jgi:Homeodomain-like domain
MQNSPYGPKDLRRVSFKRLPKAIREAGISMIERKLATGKVTDLVTISDTDWHQACRRFNAIQRLAEHPGRLGRRVREIAKMFGATDRTVRRWLSVYRRNPDITRLRMSGSRSGISISSGRQRGVPKLIHVDNGKEFHSLALRRGCERYGISLEYRPPWPAPIWCSHRALSRYAHAANPRIAGNHVLEPDRAWQISKRGACHRDHGGTRTLGARMPAVIGRRS